MTFVRQVNRKARSIECDYCGAEVGEDCKTSGNKVAPFHADRWNDARKLVREEKDSDAQTLHP